MQRTRRWYRWPIWDMDRGRITKFHLFWSEDGEAPARKQETLCGRRVHVKVGHGTYTPAMNHPEIMEREDPDERTCCKACLRRAEGIAR